MGRGEETAQVKTEPLRPLARVARSPSLKGEFVSCRTSQA
jgi:hypothetical protein